MANKVSRERLYLTRDGERVVLADDPEAASLLVAAGGELSDADVKRYKLDQYLTDAPAAWNPVAEHEARHGNNVQQAELPQAPVDPEVNEDLFVDQKAAAPKANKAKAPQQNKGE